MLTPDFEFAWLGIAISAGFLYGTEIQSSQAISGI